jgi:type II secretory pathway component GspD/PulD (secretin)
MKTNWRQNSQDELCREKPRNSFTAGLFTKGAGAINFPALCRGEQRNDMYMKSCTVAALTVLALTGCSTRERPTVATPVSAVATDQVPQIAAPLPATPKKSDTEKRTFSSFDQVTQEKEIGARMLNFEEADLKQIFELYEVVSKRTLIYSPRFNRNVRITLRNNTSLTQTEVLQALDTVLAANEIVMVYSGDLYVKACAPAEAPVESPPSLDIPWRNLPNSKSFVSYVVHLKNVDAASATSMLQPFAQLPNSIIANRESQILILRDYSSNVRRMMEVLERIDGNNAAPTAAPADRTK